MPEAIDAERAIEMIVSGKPLTAQSLATTGLVDDLAQDAVSKACRIVLEMANGARQRRCLRDIEVNPKVLEAALASARAKRVDATIAQRAALDAIAWAALPFDEGVAAERDVSDSLPEHRK